MHVVHDSAPVRMPAAHVVLWQEHSALGRHWGRLQQRITDLLRLKEAELAELSAEVVRLRGQLLVTRTAQFWNMRGHTCA